jgi:RNA-directed DNA polymerase
LRGIAQPHAETFIMAYRDLWLELTSYENLYCAYRKARKHKTTKVYVIEFEKNLEQNLQTLCSELILNCYKPQPLVNFIVRDPKTRKISKSDFRDRIVHHALCNIIEPLFEKSFIYDSYANRIGKGTLNALKRFDYFKRKASRNNHISCYVLKADIRKYFENVDHKILVSIIKKKVADKRVIGLISGILANYSEEKGMPLGNLTSQFFANVYLNELDLFVKGTVKAEYYIRYVDDFVILGCEEEELESFKRRIDEFLESRLKLQLHKDKSKIIKLGHSMTFLGFRVFYFHKLLKKSNIRKMSKKLLALTKSHKSSEWDYDKVYDFLEGWLAYARNANTYGLRQRILSDLERRFPHMIPTKEVGRYLKIQKKETLLSNKIPLYNQYSSPAI